MLMENDNISYIFNIKETRPDYDTWKSFSGGLFIKDVIRTVPPKPTCVNFSGVSADCASCCITAVTA